MHGTGVRKFLWLPSSALLLSVSQSVRALGRQGIWRIKGGNNVSFEQGIEASNKGSAERPQEPPRDHQGARRRADYPARPVQVGIIHRGRHAPLEEWP